MDEMETLYVTNRDEWRHWLSENFQRRSEIWLVIPKKHTRKPRLEYNVAVEEALCFGWIDSTVKSLDADHTIQRFSVRRPRSSFSQPNRERLRWLLEAGKVHPSVEPEATRIVSEEFVLPTDIINEIRQDKAAWENYIKLSEPYKRIRVAYIEAARKRPEEFEKRLRNFLEHTRNNKLIKGYGGIEQYY